MDTDTGQLIQISRIDIHAQVYRASVFDELPGLKIDKYHEVLPTQMKQTAYFIARRNLFSNNNQSKNRILPLFFQVASLGHILIVTNVSLN